MSIKNNKDNNDKKQSRKLGSFYELLNTDLVDDQRKQELEEEIKNKNINNHNFVKVNNSSLFEPDLYNDNDEEKNYEHNDEIEKLERVFQKYDTKIEHGIEQRNIIASIIAPITSDDTQTDNIQIDDTDSIDEDDMLDKDDSELIEENALIDEEVRRDYISALNDERFLNISTENQARIMKLNWSLGELLLVPLQKIELIIKKDFLDSINFLELKNDNDVENIFKKDYELRSDVKSKRSDQFKQKKLDFKEREMARLKYAITDESRTDEFIDTLTLGKIIGFSKVINENKYRLSRIFENNPHIEISDYKSIVLGDHIVMIRNMSSHLHPYKPAFLSYLHILHYKNFNFLRLNPTSRADITTMNLLYTIDYILSRNGFMSFHEHVVSGKFAKLVSEYINENGNDYGLGDFLQYEPPRSRQYKLNYK